jgi:hypothetical protein
LFFFKCLVGYGVVNYLVNCNVSKWINGRQ